MPSFARLLKTQTLERGPNGRYLCRYCREETRPPRRTFCSDACVHAWRLRSDTTYLRAAVFARDKGVCSGCGLNTEKWRRLQQAKLNDLSAQAARRALALLGIGPHRVKRTRKRLRILSLWDADHIVPVSRGGGTCGLENIQTLCLWCHRRKTRGDRQQGSPAGG